MKSSIRSSIDHVVRWAASRLDGVERLLGKTPAETIVSRRMGIASFDLHTQGMPAGLSEISFIDETSHDRILNLLLQTCPPLQPTALVDMLGHTVCAGEVCLYARPNATTDVAPMIRLLASNGIQVIFIVAAEAWLETLDDDQRLGDMGLDAEQSGTALVLLNQQQPTNHRRTSVHERLLKPHCALRLQQQPGDVFEVIKNVDGPIGSRFRLTQTQCVGHTF